MARMIGKAERRKGCPYSCCDPDFTKKRQQRRKTTHMWKQREKQRWKREANAEIDELT